MTSIRPLGPEDLDRFIEVREISFPAPGLDSELYRSLMSERLPYSSGLFAEGELACVATMYLPTVYFAGRTVTMGALAGVASAPQFRRRGFIRALLQDGLADLQRKGVGWCLEYPFDPRFYHRLGWQSLPVCVDLEIPAEYLYNGKPPGAERQQLSEFATLSPIYDAWARRYNFSLTRRQDPRESWKRLVSDWWLDEGGFIYRLDGAYLLFSLTREEGRTVLTVEDYAYDGGRARSELFSFIGSLHGQADTVRISLPADDPLALDHQPRHVHSRRWPMQARIVELDAALAPLTSDCETSFSIRVEDELCEWNDGTFRVETGPGGTSVAPASGQADAVMPVQTLPLLLSGLLPARSAVDQGMAEGSVDALAALAALGGGRTPFMPRSDAF